MSKQNPKSSTGTAGSYLDFCDSSTSRQIELDRLYAELLQTAELSRNMRDEIHGDLESVWRARAPPRKEEKNEEKEEKDGEKDGEKGG